MAILAPSPITVATKNAHIALRPIAANYADGSYCKRSARATAGDGGGGDFSWISSSTAIPDGDINVLPTESTTVVSSPVTIATADGTSIKYSGTVSTIGQAIVPTTFSVRVGAVVVNDLGFGTLYGVGIYGTINYLTGAWTLNTVQAWNGATAYTTGSYVFYNGVIWVALGPSTNVTPSMQQTSLWTYVALTSAASVVPSNGTAITVTYSYASASGRWVRQYTGSLDIRWFGGGTTLVADNYVPISRADYYASLSGGAVYVPALPSQFTVQTPILFKSARIHGDVYPQNNLASTLRWFPSAATIAVDLLACLSFSLGNWNMDKLTILGISDAIPPAQQWLSSGYIATAAKFVGSLSGTILTVSAMTSGTIAAGQSISAPGMAPCPLGECKIISQISGTAGGVGNYALSGNGNFTASKQAVTLPAGTNFTTTPLPSYSAFKPGTCCVNGLTKGKMSECKLQGCKVGLWLNANGGHITCVSTQFSCFFGAFNIGPSNTQDYLFFDCDFDGGGTWGGISTGNGGASFRAYRCHLGFAPYGVFMFDDGFGTTANGNAMEFYGCSYEGFGEAAIHQRTTTLASFVFEALTGTGYYSNFALGTDLVPTPGCYLFQFLGTINAFNCSRNNSWTGAPNAQALLYAGNISDIFNTAGSAWLELQSMGGSVVVGNPHAQFADYRTRRTGGDWVTRSEVLRRRENLPSGNLLADPETASNWSLSGGNTLTVTKMSTLLAGELTGYTVPLELYEECGADPTVLKFVSTNTTAGGTLATIPPTTLNTLRKLAFACWGASSTGWGNRTWQIGSVMGGTSYNNNADTPDKGFGRMIGKGITLAEMSQSSIGSLTIGSLIVSGTVTLYLVGPILSFDDYQPYNRYHGPAFTTPMLEATYTLATLPPAANWGNGAGAWCTDGRYSGESAGAGNGCKVVVRTLSGTPTWCAEWSGVAVTN